MSDAADLMVVALALGPDEMLESCPSAPVRSELIALVRAPTAKLATTTYADRARAVLRVSNLTRAQLNQLAGLVATRALQNTFQALVEHPRASERTRRDALWAWAKASGGHPPLHQPRDFASQVAVLVSRGLYMAQRRQFDEVCDRLVGAGPEVFEVYQALWADFHASSSTQRPLVDSVRELVDLAVGL